MKNKIYSINARTLFMFWGILLISIPTFAKYDYEKVKTVVEEVLVDENSIVSVYHQRGRGPLDVAYYDGDKAKIEVELRVEGDDESDLETFLSKYKIGVERLGDEVMIHSGFNIKAWNETNVFYFYQRYKIVFDDGTQINTKIRIVEAKLKLWIPKVQKLKLENNHNNIITTSLPFSLEAKVFSGDIKTGNIDGGFTLDLKYGNAELGNLKKAKIDIFTGELKMENGTEVTLNSKYAELEMKDLETLDLEIYEGEMKVENVSGNLEIEGKYAKFSIGTMKDGDWDLFECDVKLKEATVLEWKDKYGNHKINEIGNLKIDCYESDFVIEKVNNIRSDESKYAKYKIGHLDGSFESKAAYENKLNVERIGESFSGIDFKGKYGKINLPALSDYKLDMETKYGKIKYDDSALEVVKHIEKNETLTLIAKSKGTGEKSPTIKIRGYEVDIDLEN